MCNFRSQKAGPLFRYHNNKLQSTDARKVVAIHTNSDFGKTLNLFLIQRVEKDHSILGHFEPLGSVDIYLNGGKRQPGLNDQESHCFAADFYRGLINIPRPLIGYRYSSFDEVQNGRTPKTKAIKLFHGEPVPK